MVLELYIWDISLIKQIRFDHAGLSVTSNTIFRLLLNITDKFKRHHPSVFSQCQMPHKSLRPFNLFLL